MIGKLCSLVFGAKYFPQSGAGHSICGPHPWSSEWDPHPSAAGPEAMSSGCASALCLRAASNGKPQHLAARCARLLRDHCWAICGTATCLHLEFQEGQEGML